MILRIGDLVTPQGQKKRGIVTDTECTGKFAIVRFSKTKLLTFRVDKLELIERGLYRFSKEELEAEIAARGRQC